MKGAIRVLCRVRPMSSSERERGCEQVTHFPEPQVILLKMGAGSSAARMMDKNERGMKQFEFDSVFDPDKNGSQEDVFKVVRPLVQQAVDGFNVCIFAYGQTGSGKTFTMSGATGGGDSDEESLLGITPRAVNELFALQKKEVGQFEIAFDFTMIELYKDKMMDLLLAKTDKQPVLKVGGEERPAHGTPPLALSLTHSPTRSLARSPPPSGEEESHRVCVRREREVCPGALRVRAARPDGARLRAAARGLHRHELRVLSLAPHHDHRLPRHQLLHAGGDGGQADPGRPRGQRAHGQVGRGGAGRQGGDEHQQVAHGSGKQRVLATTARSEGGGRPAVSVLRSGPAAVGTACGCTACPSIRTAV
jgi:hypothetical protein